MSAVLPRIAPSISTLTVRHISGDSGNVLTIYQVPALSKDRSTPRVTPLAASRLALPTSMVIKAILATAAQEAIVSLAPVHPLESPTTAISARSSFSILECCDLILPCRDQMPGRLRLRLR